jgi:hypothetical protein
MMRHGTGCEQGRSAHAFLVQIYALHEQKSCGRIAFIMENSSFSLSYVESDSRTHQPSACIYVKLAGADEMLITAPNLTFVELDSEIRRLHAELDAIRAHAKKKFYKAEAAAAGS